MDNPRRRPGLFRSTPRLKRGADRNFWLSLAVSTLAHLAMGLYVRSLPPRAGVLMLVKAGDEAMELEPGSRFQSVAAQAAPADPDPETIAAEKDSKKSIGKRGDGGLPEIRIAPVHPDFAETRPVGVIPGGERFETPVVSEKPESEPGRPEPLAFPPEPLSQRKYGPRPQGGDPETYDIAFPPSLFPPKKGRKPDNALAGEIRFASMPDNSPEDGYAATPASGSAWRGLTEVSGPDSPLARAGNPEADAGRLTRPRRLDHHKREGEPAIVPPDALRPARGDEPEARSENPAAPSQASPDYVLGGGERSRGVWQRAEAEGTLIPPYPAGARRRGEEGIAVIGADIDPAGRCLAAEIEVSSGFAELDAIALDSVFRASFRPARLDGIPKPARERFEFEFRLR